MLPPKSKIETRKFIFRNNPSIGLEVGQILCHASLMEP